MSPIFGAANATRLRPQRDVWKSVHFGQRGNASPNAPPVSLLTQPPGNSRSKQTTPIIQLERVALLTILTPALFMEVLSKDASAPDITSILCVFYKGSDHFQQEDSWFYYCIPCLENDRSQIHSSMRLILAGAMHQN